MRMYITVFAVPCFDIYKYCMHGLTLLQPEGNLMDEFLSASWIIYRQRDYTVRVRSSTCFLAFLQVSV